MTTLNRASQPPTNGTREAPFTLQRNDSAESGGDGLTLDGYGAVFNRETVIDSWEGRFRETILPGSMRRSFRESPPRIQFDHGRHPLIGSIPMAKLERIAEESHPELAPEGGAHIVGRVFDNWLMAPVRDAIAAGVIDGMSFRFEVIREAWMDHRGNKLEGRDLMRELERCWDLSVPESEIPVRQLKELRVPEMGPVVWPAYTDTSVGVRSQVIDLGRLHEPETRKLLATAVFLAESADQQDDAQQGARDERAAEHPSTDAQPVTGDQPADEHPSNDRDAQPAATPHLPNLCTGFGSAADEHPSNPSLPSSIPRGHRDIDIWVRKSRDAILDINAKKDRYDRLSFYPRSGHRRPA